MIKKVFSLFIFLTSTAWCCEINLPSAILISGKTKSTSFLTAKNCPVETLHKTVDVLSSLDGKIASFQIEEMISDLSQGKVLITPSIIHITQLSTLSREQLDLPSGTQLKLSSEFGSESIQVLNTGDRIELDCSNCTLSKQQNLTLRVNGLDGTQKNLTVKVDFIKMVRAYKTLSQISPFSEIKPNYNLTEIYTEEIPHTDLISDLSTLKFYKTNKPINAGELLKRSDLTAINLVRAGLKTEILIENDLLKIKTHGISRSSGSFGDTIEVFNPIKNKKYLGKIIDHNKVLVEL
jgi:flagella basal body P-ring formation protein FlgA